jgi:hypothetical protein
MADDTTLYKAPAPKPRSEPFPNGGGLRVSMSRIPGMTGPKLLRTPFLFQCPPSESFSRSFAFSHSDYDTLRAGQQSRPVGMQLRTITFDTLFLDYGAPFTLIDPLPRNYYGNRSRADGSDDGAFASDAPEPLHMTDELEAILESGTPFYLHVGQRDLWQRMDVDAMPATLRTLSVEERAGEVDTRYVNVAFTEFRHPSLGPRKAGGGKGVKGKSDRLPTSVTVAQLPAGEDNLYALAKRYYGSQAKWRVIAKANGLAGGGSSSSNVPPSYSLKSVYGVKSKHKIRIPAL